MLWLVVSQIHSIGVALGSPSGFSLLFQKDVRLLAGWNLEASSFYFSLDKNFKLRAREIQPLRLYIGIGGYVGGFKVRQPGQPEKTQIEVGLRIPVGIYYEFEEVPLDLGLEIAPAMGIVPSTDFGFFADIYIMFRLD